MYECTIVNSTATTMYEITWPNSSTCMLSILNSRFSGSSDECQNRLAITHADRTIVRTEGDWNYTLYTSNISITVPDVTSPTSPIILKCLSDESIIGEVTLNIITSGKNQLLC